MKPVALLVAASLLGAPLAVAAQSPDAAAPPAAATAPAPAPPLELSLDEAVARGLAANLGALVAAGELEEARGERTRARSALLPRIDGSLGESRQVINLQAYGLPVAPGESPLVGPFDVYDIRIHLAENLLDLAAGSRSQAARERLDASRLTYAAVRDRVAAGVIDLYLGVLSEEARIDAARAQVATAETTERSAEHQQQAGTAAGIDVLRAEVRLAAERQGLIDVENRAAKRRLELAQAIGAPLDRPLELTDRIGFTAGTLQPLAAALAEAKASRPDLAAARATVAAAESAVAAARRERLPSLEIHGDYGKIGPQPPSALVTYTIAGGLMVPLFEGGRIVGDVAAARGRLTQAQAQLDDLERQVERDVRSAYLDVDAAARQVTVADQARDLAAQQLQQARDRFASGVADDLEVVAAQQEVAAANERYVSSLYAFHRAKVALALSLGAAEKSASAMLKGENR